MQRARRQSTVLKTTFDDAYTTCLHAGPRDCIGQNLALMEARAVLAVLCARFELEVAPEMGSREDVRADEVMKLTLQCSKGILLQLKLRG